MNDSHSQAGPPRHPGERLDRVQSITETALTHLRLDDLLVELLERVRDLLEVDTVAIFLLDEERNELVARAAKGIEEEVEQGVRIPVGRGFAGKVAAERRPIFLPDVEHADVLNPLLRKRGISSLLGVPLIVEASVIGILHVGSLTPREFTAEEATLLTLAADRIAVGVDHARLFEAERAARAAADRAIDRLNRVEAITEATLAHLSLDEELLDELLVRVRQILEVDTATILLLDADSGELAARAAKGLEESVRREIRVPLGAGFAGRVAAERRAIVIENVDEADVVNPVLREEGIRSLLGVPLIVEGRLTGVLHVGTRDRRHFSADSVSLLELAADRIALALDRARIFEREHKVAETLQRSLLLEKLPTTPGFAMAARYVPGADEANVGGDWYDVIPLAGGRLGLAMGDVASRGLRAASVMGQFRNTLRAYALDGDPPAVVVTGVARVARGLDQPDVATLVYMTLDQETRELRYASAGHPPPLVVAHGEARFLEGGRAVPLGAVSDPRYEEAVDTLPEGGMLILYTDGLVERPDMWIDEGLRRLADAAVGADADPEELCDLLVRELVGSEPVDDVALLAIQAIPVAEGRLELELPATPTTLADMRRELRRWLGRRGAGEQAAYDILVAASEAAANAVEHAYGPGDAVFRIEAEEERDGVTVVIRDYGQWRPPRGENRGRGTLLMQELMDDFAIASSADGTVVRLHRTLEAVAVG